MLRQVLNIFPLAGSIAIVDGGFLLFRWVQ